MQTRQYLMWLLVAIIATITVSTRASFSPIDGALLQVQNSLPLARAAGIDHREFAAQQQPQPPQFTLPSDPTNIDQETLTLIAKYADMLLGSAMDPECKPPSNARDFAPCGVKYMSYRCSATTSVRPPCPTDCNASCHAGMYCPLLPPSAVASYNATESGAISFPCPNGGVCPQQTSCVWACPSGMTCSGGQAPRPCPRGHFCRSGTSEPTPCSFIDFCGDAEGLKEPRTALFGLIVVLSSIVASLTVIFVTNYCIEARQQRKQQEVLARHETFNIAETLKSPTGSSSSHRHYSATSAGSSGSSNSQLSDGKLRAIQQSNDCDGDELATIIMSTGGDEGGGSFASLRQSSVHFDSGVSIDYVCDNMHLELAGPNPLRAAVNRLFRVEHKPQVILESVSCIIRPGTTVAVMGPSGSGKTSFMNVLSGKAWAYGTVRGTCKVSGRDLTPRLVKELQHFTGYVPQDDVMPRQCTVNENISFQARGRLPPETPVEEVRLRIATITDALGLGRVSASRIGDEHVRGISGGQRKRVNMAMEVAAQPAVCFGDELTSGLDSTSSLVVCNFLRDLAVLCGTTVICVVHQPRYEIFEQFDHVILLAVGGHVVYSGPTSGVRAYFAEFGFEVPANCNPADFYMDVISADSTVKSSKEGVTVQTLVKESRKRFEAEAATYCAQEVTEADLRQRNRTGLLRQLQMYVKRSSTLLYVRQPARILLEALICCGGASMLGFCLPSTVFSEVVPQYALGGLLFSLFTHFSALPTFGPDFAVAQREISTGFRPLAYFLGKDLAFMPKLLYLPLLFSLQYTIIAPRAQFWEYLSTFACLGYAASGSGLFLSAALPESTAQMAAVLAAFVSLLLSGFNPTLETIWAVFPRREAGQIFTGLSPLRWVLDALLSSEYLRSTEFWRLCTTPALYNTGFNPDVSFGMKCLVMIGLGLGLRLMALIVLIVKTR